MDDKTRKNHSRSALRKHCKKIEADIETATTACDRANSVKLKGLKLNYENQIERIRKVNEELQGLITDETELEAES